MFQAAFTFIRLPLTRLWASSTEPPGLAEDGDEDLSPPHDDKTTVTPSSTKTSPDSPLARTRGERLRVQSDHRESDANVSPSASRKADLLRRKRQWEKAIRASPVLKPCRLPPRDSLSEGANEGFSIWEEDDTQRLE